MLKYLKPVDANLKMKRLGPDEDGGYVMPEKVLDECVALFTYGVGNEIRYEMDFHNQYRKPIFVFDHTIGYNPPEYMNHTRQGLGFDENMNCFINHYIERKIDGPVYLKVDIEGGEYPYFLSTDIDTIADLTIGLSIEVHWLEKEKDRDDFIKMMERLSKRFTLVHTHGNTWGDMFNYQGNDVLNVYELSFINTDYITDEIKPISIEYPIIGLDYSNNRNKEDFKFDFFKKYIMEQRFIISLTTLPNRNASLRENLNSLLSQNYSNFEIHLNIPKKSPLNGEWDELNIPNDDKLKVFWVDDIGAITKLYYTLKRTTHRIITVDDDFIYHSEMLNEYNNLTQVLPNEALGFAGIYPVGIEPSDNFDLNLIGCIPTDIYTKVGVLEGYKSICYNPTWFDEEFFTEWYNKHYNDDLIISSWLGYKNIDKCIVPYSSETIFENRMLSFPLVVSLNNPPSGQHHFRQYDGGSSVSYKAFYNSELGKYIKK